jgi:hypothetical protein
VNVCEAIEGGSTLTTAILAVPELEGLLADATLFTGSNSCQGLVSNVNLFVAGQPIDLLITSSENCPT